MLGPIGPLARASTQLGRSTMKSFIRNGSHSHGGVPGENLPFDINNKARLTLNFFLYVGTGIGAPFVILWYQMAKK